ncbi:pseudaminic acid cytidylyltransferase [Geoalkalibacter halelectricus]|uniref:Pseudaminic acid cytidylyltransferase n=1 Tax=Geoalkalibacter halelectricus TaxID=2847045 RepID=A0ABY5ZU81_9BACT|nr:pseudaminic acid cytidylyltransferase [Geoalkalibacter halelectricus]MDO3377980.1 pseudaminic acid cytidylyltransferase [Geoalkalibacter halelectricus]UWZ81517.1 pseudaminic acid cytidylyltransferase [Geoalkalibacter halelectricus]
MNIAVIPARGGSKRIPRKNIKPFGGKPMIAWSIEAARDSGCFERIIVSTDDQEIASVSVACGAEVPFLRPANLADDQTGTAAVVRHALQWLQGQGQQVAYVCCLYATAPFVAPDDLRKGLVALQNAPDKHYAFSVTSFAFPIQRAIRMHPQGGVEPFQPECIPLRSQDLEEAYHDAGQFYWGRPEAFLSGISVFARHSIPIVLPRHRVQDIDTPEDWVRAEYLHKAMMMAAEDDAHRNPS